MFADLSKRVQGDRSSFIFKEPCLRFIREKQIASVE